MRHCVSFRLLFLCLAFCFSFRRFHTYLFPTVLAHSLTAPILFLGNMRYPFVFRLARAPSPSSSSFSSPIFSRLQMKNLGDWSGWCVGFFSLYVLTFDMTGV